MDVMFVKGKKKEKGITKHYLENSFVVPYVKIKNFVNAGTRLTHTNYHDACTHIYASSN